MKWNYIKATEFCESVRDGTHDTPKPVEKGYKLVTGKHIRDGIIDPEDAYYISVKDYEKINERSQVDQWDVLMSMIGNGLGRSAVVKSKPEYAIKNIALFKVGNEAKAKWLHYYLSGPDGQGLIYGSLQGSGQPFISLSYLRDFPIPNPPADVIENVVSVLEKYDNLIENNQKQIKLLEEAAQRLYKEWFVDFRFPGFENKEIVDGVPEGWKKGNVGRFFKTVLGGTPSRSKTDYWGGDIPWINSGEVNRLRIIKESEFITESGLKNSSTKLMPIHTTVLAITGATLGQVSYTEIETCANQSVVGIYDKTGEYSTYIYLCISNEIKKIINEAIGGAQQHINKEVVNKFEILIPDIDINERLKTIVIPMFDKITNLYFENERLSEARNRLIPQLMSGKIEL